MDHNTHAPWRLVTNWRGKLAVVDTRNDGRHTEIGRVCNLPRGRDGRGVAIGRLISAAPDLLEALQRLLSAAEYGGGWHTMDPAKAAARAAIARAEGE